MCKTSCLQYSSQQLKKNFEGISMKIWNRLFGKNNEKVKEANLPTPITPEEETLAPAPYDYGLDELGIFLSSRDYGWTAPDKSHKKVILTNPLDCTEKICLMGMVSAWRGTGHTEWEVILGGWFILTVLDAIEKNVNEADITNLFNRDFLASRDRVFTQAQVYEHLIKWFDIVEETDEVLKLRIHI